MKLGWDYDFKAGLLWSKHYWCHPSISGTKKLETASTLPLTCVWYSPWIWWYRQGGCSSSFFWSLSRSRSPLASPPRRKHGHRTPSISPGRVSRSPSVRSDRSLSVDSDRWWDLVRLVMERFHVLGELDDTYKARHDSCIQLYLDYWPWDYSQLINL